MWKVPSRSVCMDRVSVNWNLPFPFILPRGRFKAFVDGRRGLSLDFSNSFNSWISIVVLLTVFFFSIKCFIFWYGEARYWVGPEANRVAFDFTVSQNYAHGFLQFGIRYVTVATGEDYFLKLKHNIRPRNIQRSYSWCSEDLSELAPGCLSWFIY